MFSDTMVVMILAELSGAVTAAIDGLVIARFLGNEAMAAYGIASPYFSIMSIISGVFMVGCQGITVNYLSKGERDKANKVMTAGFGASFILAFIVAALCFAFSRQLCIAFGARGDAANLVGDASNYFKGLLIGAPFWVGFVVLTPILQLDADSGLAKTASFVLAIVDVVADFANVLVFKGGIFGMGLATSLSHIAGFAVVMCHFLKKERIFSLNFKELDIHSVPKMLHDGLPRATTMVARALGPIIINAIIIKVAADIGMVAISVQRNITFIAGACGWGIGGAVLMLSGMFYEERNRDGLKDVLKCMLRSICFYVLPICVLVFFLAPNISALYVSEEGAIRDASACAIRWYALSLPFLAFNTCAAGYLQSIGKFGISNVINAFIECFACGICAVILGKLFGIDGVWAAFCLGQLLLSAAVLCIVYAKRKKYGENGMLLLPDDFDAGNTAIQRALISIEDVVAFSQEMGEICKSRGISQRRSYMVCLCMEELAGNVIEHGFSDERSHHLEVRAVFESDDVIIAMKDDCEKFDITEKIKNWSFDPEHPEKNMGIRMAVAASKDITYSNSMKINTVIIKV